MLGKAALITNIWTKYTVIAIPGSLAIWFIFLPIYAFAAPKLGFSTEYTNILPVLLSSPRFWLMAIALPSLCLVRDFAWKYAKRMYYPQSYHHVQEIQKYNIQDYRPRYVKPYGLYSSFTTTANMNLLTAWSNSKKQSAKSAKCSACASSAATLFRKRTRVKRACCRLTTRPRSVAAMVR